MSSDLTSLDGRTLEGGGQLLRLAISLSALTYLPVHVWDIRANRAPRKASQPAGGLKPAHLAAVEWLAKATAAETKGMSKGSQELNFQPQQQTNQPPTVENHSRSSGKRKEQTSSDGWECIYSGDSIIRKETCIQLSSPGSICLILQAILPYLLFHSSSIATPTVEAKSNKAPCVPLRVTIHGGTNVSKSPSIEYVSHVLIPMLVEKVGIPPVTIEVIKRGWSSGRADIGIVQFDLTPFRRDFQLPEFHFSKRGEVSRIHVSILAPNPSARDTLRGKVTEKLLARHPDVEILFPTEEDTSNGARLYLLIVAETSNGYRLGRDCLWERKSSSGTLEAIASTVTKEIDVELERGGCVDEYMQDQLVVFQALAQGRSVVDSGRDMHATLHTKTARWVTEQLLGLAFDDSGVCTGCGFQVGECFTDRKIQQDPDDPAAGIERLKIS
ncbi:MAG: hypothetical protein Q9220_000269 [cf. Caloplaca sp. 1 TL-2023]